MRINQTSIFKDIERANSSEECAELPRISPKIPKSLGHLGGLGKQASRPKKRVHVVKEHDVRTNAQSTFTLTLGVKVDLLVLALGARVVGDAHGPIVIALGIPDELIAEGVDCFRHGGALRSSPSS